MGGHTCALLDNGAVKCWGNNYRGELGLGDTTSRGANSGEMGDSLPEVDLGTDRTAASVVAGYGYTCALLDNGAVKCWGSGLKGRLGLGDTARRGDSSDEMGDSLPEVDLGTDRIAAVLSTAAIKTTTITQTATSTTRTSTTMSSTTSSTTSTISKTSTTSTVSITSATSTTSTMSATSTTTPTSDDLANGNHPAASTTWKLLTLILVILAAEFGRYG